MSGLWEELKTRKIFKAATIYAAVTWGIIQIADILLPVLGISEWVMSSMVLLAFTGFPLALILGWALDLKHERNLNSNKENTEHPKVKVSSRVAELIVISAFSLGAAYLYYNSASEPAQASIVESSKVQSLVEPVSAQKTIAVLPFANFSDSTDDEFFADGLSEELLNVLAKNKKLRVAARTSSFQYKNTNVNIKKIAEELGVQYILEGSVRRSGELIRVTAQLIKADDDVHIFSKTWDRNVTNVFEVQDEIAQSVLGDLKVSLLGENEQNSSEIGTHDIAAFAEYSRGLALIRNRSKSDFENAIIHFNKALEIDPDFVDAMTMLAETYLLQVSYSWLEFEQAFALAKPLVDKAFELNPESASIHAVKGLMHWQLAGHEMQHQKSTEHSKHQLEIAKQHLNKAIDLNPSLAEAYMWYGSILQNEGNYKDGAKLHKKAYEIDPRAAVVGFNRANDLIMFGDYKQAMDVFNSVVRNNPNYPNVYSIAGDVSYSVGQLDQAYSMYTRLAELSEEDSIWLLNSNKIYIPMGKYQLAQQNVDHLRKAEMEGYAGKLDYLQASIWLASGDLESFNHWTESFKEDTQEDNERFWRGFSSMNQQKWKFAIEDLSKTLSIMRKDKPSIISEHTIRIQLYLARAYQALGNKLKSTNFLNIASDEIQHLNSEGFNSQRTRYQQAALAALKGEQHQAISLLRQSVQEGFVDFWWTKVDPSFYNVRKDPTYITIKDEFNIRMKLMQNSIESQYGKLSAGA